MIENVEQHWSVEQPLPSQHKSRREVLIQSNRTLFFFFPKTVGVHQTMLENVVGSNFQRDFFKNKLMTIV
jgi:hypothetical protein